MNKLQLIKQYKYYVLACKLLSEINSIDFIKLCFMVFVVSQEKNIKHINDFFDILGSNFKTKQNDLILIKECVNALEKMRIINITSGKVTLNKTIDVTNFGSIQPLLLEMLSQINSMSINSFVRMVSQYA